MFETETKEDLAKTWLWLGLEAFMSLNIYDHASVTLYMLLINLSSLNKCTVSTAVSLNTIINLKTLLLDFVYVAW